MHKQTTFGAVVKIDDARPAMPIFTVPNSSQLKTTIKSEHIEEAATIVERYPRPEILIAKMQNAFAMDSDVGYEIYRRLKKLYLRAIEINAWSTGKSDVSEMVANLYTDPDAAEFMQTELGLKLDPQSVDVSNKFIPLLFLPYSSSYLELYKRLKQADGSGLLGFKLTTDTNAFVFTGMPDVLGAYDYLKSNVIEGNVCAFYKDGNTMRYQHGLIDVAMPLDVALLYVTIMFNSARSKPRYFVKKKQNDPFVVGGVSGTTEAAVRIGYASRALSDYIPSSEISHGYDYRVFVLKKDKQDTKQREQVGDYWGYGVSEWYADPAVLTRDGRLVQPHTKEMRDIHSRGLTSNAKIEAILNDKDNANAFTSDKHVSDVIKFLKTNYITNDYKWDDLWGLHITTLLNNQYYKDVR